MAARTNVPTFNYADWVAERARAFTGRDWLFQAIDAWAPFLDVVKREEQIPGVQFGDLAQRLAGHTGRSSKGALTQVWQLVQQA